MKRLPTNPTPDRSRQLGLHGIARAFEELTASPTGGELSQPPGCASRP
jgi:hypothetical protein